MAELSLPWGGIVLGDAGPYSDDDWSDIWRNLLCFDRAAQGPIAGVLNELVVSGANSPIQVASGMALVDGKFYSSDSSVTVVVPTPTVSVRIDRIVLRKSWAAQTVRITRIAGVEGGGAPAITQVDGTTWDCPLAQISVTTGGVITITDEREFCWTPLSLLTQLTKRDTPTDGDIIVSDSSEDGDWKAVDRVRIAIVEPFSFKDSTAVSTGNDAARIPIPTDMDGYELSYVRAKVKSAPAGGPVTIQLHNIDNAVDMLTTEITIDDGETSSETAAAPAVIKSNGDENVDDGDDVRVDVDAANAATGLQIEAGYKPR
jgi:hypothetical protein